MRGINTKELELEEELSKKGINIATITETKKKTKGTKDMNKYTMIYSGVEQECRAKCGVAILIDRKWKNKLESYTYINERIVTARFRVERGHMTVIAVYAPEEGKKEETKQFYNVLQSTIEKYVKSDQLIISGDLNARVGKIPIPNVVGMFGESVINENGEELRQFATFNQLKIANTFFRKRDIHKYTWSSRGLRSLIDYVIVNNKLSATIQDVSVHRGSDIYSDHFLVVSKIKIMARWKKSNVKHTRENEDVYKVYLLQEESIRKLYESRLTKYIVEIPTEEDVNKEWEKIIYTIKKAANEVIGKKRKIRNRKGLRIWNSEIKEAIEEKRRAFKIYLQKKTETTFETYKEKRKIAKQLTRKAHEESWNRFISEVEHDMYGRQIIGYKLIKHINKPEKDTASLNIINEQKWINHYRNLWYNKELNKIEIDLEEENERGLRQVDAISLQELDDVLNTMKNRKAPGIDGVNVELIKHSGIICRLRILHLINNCWKRCQIPDNWTTAIVKNIFKKGERNDCENYRGISLMNTGYKIYAKIINNRIMKIADCLIGEEQSGFRKGRSCIDNVFVIKQIIEQRREKNLETHIAFVDFEKAFDRVDRLKLWKILEKEGYPQHLISVIRSIYKNTSIIIENGSKRSEQILTNVGLRQGCSLSPTLFNIYINDILKEWKTLVDVGIKLCDNIYVNTLVFADDQIIIQENEENLQKSMYLLNKICQSYNFKMSVKKTKIMAFKGKDPIRSKIVIEDKILEQVSDFKYLGCEISFKYDKDIEQKVNKFQAICGTIQRTFKNKIRKETKMKFYKVMALPTLLYGSETWVPTQKLNSKIQAAEMKFLRSVKGCTRMDKIRNDAIREELNIESVNNKIIENRQKWIEHLVRMEDTRFPKAVLNYMPRGRRDRGRPRRRWKQL